MLFVTKNMKPIASVLTQKNNRPIYWCLIKKYWTYENVKKDFRRKNYAIYDYHDYHT